MFSSLNSSQKKSSENHPFQKHNKNTYEDQETEGHSLKFKTWHSKLNTVPMTKQSQRNTHSLFIQKFEGGTKLSKKISKLTLFTPSEAIL